MATIAEMASRGATKMSRKEPIMARNWDAAKTRMISGYEATPFGSTRKANYRDAISVATYRTDTEKWRRKWEAAMAI